MSVALILENDPQTHSFLQMLRKDLTTVRKYFNLLHNDFHLLFDKLLDQDWGIDGPSYKYPMKMANIKCSLGIC